jgi:hypothetical protein
MQGEAMKYLWRLLRALAACLAALASDANAATCTTDFLLEASNAPAAQLQCLSTLKYAKELSRFRGKEIDEMLNLVYVRSVLKGDPADADMARILVEEFKRRSPRNRKYDDMVFSTLLSVGRIQEAERAPFKRAPLIPRRPLSAPVAEGAVRYWEVQYEPVELVEKSANLQLGSHIVVYSAPGCHFCGQAVKAISADPALDGVFKTQSFWVEVPNVNYAPTYYRYWKRVSPMPMGIVLDRKGWPERKIAATPYFILLKDGRVTGEVIGWGIDQREKLAQLLEANGFTHP